MNGQTERQQQQHRAWHSSVTKKDNLAPLKSLTFWRYTNQIIIIIIIIKLMTNRDVFSNDTPGRRDVLSEIASEMNHLFSDTFLHLGVMSNQVIDLLVIINSFIGVHPGCFSLSYGRLTICKPRQSKRLHMVYIQDYTRLMVPPFPQIDIIGDVVIVRRVRGKTIRSVLCNIVCNNCAQCDAHTYEQTNSSLHWVLSHWAHFTVLDSFLYCVLLCVVCMIA